LEDGKPDRGYLQNCRMRTLKMYGQRTILTYLLCTVFSSLSVNIKKVAALQFFQYPLSDLWVFKFFTGPRIRLRLEMASRQA
jgi:hypothetical protein